MIRRSGEIEPDDLPQEIRNPSDFDKPMPHRKTAASPQFDNIPADNDRRAMRSQEDLLQLLERFKWNKTAVARYLGVNRTTVWRMMKRWKLN